MKIEGFRITNFRSVVDSDWCRLAPDNVTVLVGQNESGKTSILEALLKTFSTEPIVDEEVRFDSPLPKTYLRVSLSLAEIQEAHGAMSEPYSQAIAEFLIERHGAMDVAFGWTSKNSSYEGTIDIEDPGLAAALEQAAARNAELPEAERSVPPVTAKTIAQAIFKAGPVMVFFSQSQGLLPNSIDIQPDKKLAPEGRFAATNFLTVAGIDLSELLALDMRGRQNYLDRANDRVTREFNRFWTQVIGRNRPLKLQCTLEHYGAPLPPGKTAGQPYLSFWISDALTRLYPGQRSAGVRWFASFFLQLKATERQGNHRIFLLDEPGANLHSRAQEDVLRLIASLSPQIPIIYSTHSQDMIEFEKLYRIRAVQRDGEADDSRTKVFEAEHLAAASSDTLTPVLNAIGTNLYRQQIIPARGNVILEEPSAHYYLKGFWALVRCNVPVHFIAATGANKVPQLALMFTGWGLKFGVVLDDDSRGRGVFNELKRDLFGNDDVAARANLLKISDCNGIEDIFSRDDFSRFVADGYRAVDEGQSPSNWAKTGGRSKPILAYGFLAKVLARQITIDDLQDETQERIRALVAAICEFSAVRQPAA